MTCVQLCSVVKYVQKTFQESLKLFNINRKIEGVIQTHYLM